MRNERTRKGFATTYRDRNVWLEPVVRENGRPGWKMLDLTLEIPRVVYRFDGAAPEPLEVPYFPWEQKEWTAGDLWTVEMAAPGAGRIVYEVKKVDAAGAWCVKVEDTSRVMSPAECR